MSEEQLINWKKLPAVLILSAILILSACNPFEDTEIEAETEDEAEAEAVVEVESETEPEVQVEAESDVEEDSEFVDGQYSASGQYTSPAGVENVSVSVTIEDDVIVSASFSAESANPVSQKLQGQFKDGYLEVVQGMNIDDVQLDVVNGSSLTPKGFNDALEKIKMEARA